MNLQSHQDSSRRGSLRAHPSYAPKTQWSYHGQIENLLQARLLCGESSSIGAQSLQVELDILVVFKAALIRATGNYWSWASEK
jgi:hypothetical protein